MAVTKSAASITVEIGKSCKVVFDTQEHDPISYFEVPFDSHTTGAVVISMNEKSTVGPEITDGAGDCNVSSDWPFSRKTKHVVADRRRSRLLSMLSPFKFEHTD
jgi:hypothetical protein